MTTLPFGNFAKRHGMELIKCDQGAMGHNRRKPTTLMGNLPGLDSLQDLRQGRRDGSDHEFLEVDLKTRMQQTAAWAAWAPGLVAAVKQATRMFLMELPSLRKMSLADWKQHALQNHIPYRRDCGLCVQEMGQDVPHRRKKLADAGNSVYVMSADIAGPFCKGWDPGLSMEGRYALIATVPVPVSTQGRHGGVSDGGRVHQPEHPGGVDRSGDAALHAGEHGGGLGPGGALHAELPDGGLLAGDGILHAEEHGGGPDPGGDLRPELFEGGLPAGDAALHAGERGGGLDPGGALQPGHLDGDVRDDGPVADGVGSLFDDDSPGDQLLEDLREMEEVLADPLADLGEDDGDDLKDLMEEDEDSGLAATKPFPIQNITLMEVLPSRSTKDVIQSLSRLLARFRALGIPTYRFHSDRARELLARPTRDWVGSHNMIQTATCGDDPPSNGRVESELNQWKRRLRLTMKSSGASPEEWPAVGRHAMEERTRHNFEGLVCRCHR